MELGVLEGKTEALGRKGGVLGKEEVQRMKGLRGLRESARSSLH